MTGKLRATILGCGSSGGVPRIGGHWGDCDPSNPKNARRRCSLLLERDGPDGTTTVLVDTSPDLRLQLLDAGVGRLDGVIYTHAHADHVHGIDDLRMVVINMRERVNVWAHPETETALLDRFAYVFHQPEGSPYPPILQMHQFTDAFEVTGPGGPIKIQPFEVDHGSVHTLGLRIGDMAYVPDVIDIAPQNWAHLTGLEVLILDALRRMPHPTHLHLEKSLEWIAEAAPRRAVLTNMHVDLDYDTLAAETPDHISPAFDGMVIEIDLP